MVILRTPHHQAEESEAEEHEHLRNLNCKRIQVDEIWAFCYSKQKNVPAEKQGQFGYGDVWTGVAIDADTKLILVGSLDHAAMSVRLRSCKTWRDGLTVAYR